MTVRGSTTAICETLHAAVEHRDLSVIATCFTDSSLLEEVAETERFIASHDDLQQTRHGKPWYYGGSQRQSLFVTAVEQNYVEVLEWLFAPERFRLMPATLELVWWRSAKRAVVVGDVEILELLLCFAETRLPLTMGFEPVATLLRFGLTPPSEEVLQILLAHGASIQPDGLGQQLLRSESLTTLEFAATEGAFVVGAPVDYKQSHLGAVDVARRRLQLGMDAGASVVVDAASGRHAGVVELYVSEGYGDVDAQDAQGNTALDYCLGVRSWDSDEILMSLAQLLLHANASTASTRTPSASVTGPPTSRAHDVRPARGSKKQRRY